MNHHFSRLAQKFPDTKFLRILDSSCVPNYPEKYLPTVFIYENGCLRNSMMGDQECGGRNVLEEGKNTIDNAKVRDYSHYRL